MYASPVSWARAVRPDAVDVVFRLVGDVEVHHGAERLHVDAARGDVRRHEHPVAALLEPGERRCALGLAAVAVDPRAGHPVLVQEIGQPVGAVLRPREHEDASRDVPRKELQQEARLAVRGHGVDRVGDADRRSGLPVDVDPRRVAQQRPAELDDRGRQRRGEEQRLAVARESPPAPS